MNFKSSLYWTSAAFLGCEATAPVSISKKSFRLDDRSYESRELKIAKGCGVELSPT